MLVAAILETWPRFVGEVALLTIAATMVGYLVNRLVPASLNPGLFAVMVPLLILATLAYLGSMAAATALLLFLAIAVLGFVFGVM